MGNQTGEIGETFVANQLKKQGWRIVKRNFKTRLGEIDIIAENHTYILFVEVKTRRQDGLTNPYEAVTAGKQKRIRLAAQQYLLQYPSLLQPRFDVAAVYTEKMQVVKTEILENAF